MSAPLGRVRGVCLDLDGVLYLDGAPIPGAADAVSRLRAAGLPIRFVTNTTSRSRRLLTERLRALGFAAEAQEVHSAPAAAAAALHAWGITRVDLLLQPGALEEFAAFTITPDEPQAVVVGDLGDAWTPAILNRAMNQIFGGARLVALCKSRAWRRASGLVMDAGPYIAALEFATGRAADVVGKPSPDFFRAAVSGMGLSPSEVVMIGDDPESDVAAARAVGLLGVLVLTGKAGALDAGPRGGVAGDGSSARGPIAADAVFPSVVEAVEAILRR